MTLYEMTAEARAVYDALCNSDLEEAERNQVIADTLEAIGADEKVDSYGVIISQLNADAAELVSQAEVFKAEAQRLLDRAQVFTGNVDRMLTAVGDFLTASGQDKIKTARFTASWRKLPDKVVFTDETKVPKKYLRIVTSPDKTAIKAAIQAGVKVRGAALQGGRKAVLK